MSETKEKAGKLKVKAKILKPKNLSSNDEPIKIDLSKPKTEEQDAIQVGETKEIPVVETSGDSEKVDEQVQESSPIAEVEEEKPIIEEVKDEEEVISIGEKMEPQAETEAEEPIKQNINLPENIEKVVDFMKETGGTLEDYVRLNADYTSVDSDTLLREYYKQTKSHLDSEEISFLLEDNFEYDEELDEARDIRKKKLAYKEEVAKARKHLDGLKSQYYDEIKLRPGVTQEQKKATDFFNRYNEEQNVAEQQHKVFTDTTKDYFTKEFKGFDFSVGDKKFRYGVKNPSEVADNQSNINNIVKKFLNDKGDVTDVKGYHKAMYAAQHADTIAQHFYEQGKADAVRNVAAKSNNISNEARASAPSDVFVGGFKVKSISGLDSSKLKIKARKFN
jgi:hypothetical protein|tara:strand:+ start:945 stop:2117 length:1173 start_codon:yes stop_codon:yes gene_type:complete